MDLPMSLGSFGLALQSGDHTAVHSRLSKAAERARNSNHRTHRNAKLRSKLRTLSLPQDVQEFEAANPEAHGLPRSYKIEFNDVRPGQDVSSIDGSRLVFGQFGSETGGITVCDHIIDSKNISYHASTKSYHIIGPASKPDAREYPVTGHFEFNSAIPTGTFGVNSTAFNVTLVPEPLKFSVKVSANAGAYFSTSHRKLVWTEGSNDWKNATWEKTMEFGYDVKVVSDPILGQLAHIENFFTDKASVTPVTFSLTSTEYGVVYTSIMDGVSSSDGSLLSTIVSDRSSIPDPPASRVHSNVDKKTRVASVFPDMAAFKFSPIGDSFVGAYRDKKNNVYAVIGEIVPDSVPGMLSSISQPPASLPVDNISPFTDEVVSIPHLAVKPAGVDNGLSLSPAAAVLSKWGRDVPLDKSPYLMAVNELQDDTFSSDPAAVDVSAPEYPNQMDPEETTADSLVISVPQPHVTHPHTMLGSLNSSPVNVDGLLALNPMVEDATDPSGWRDVVAESAMQDFHDIIVYYMDDDLRQAFIQISPIVLTDSVLKIATDDHGNPGTNKAFYQKLQTPYLAAFLAGSSMPEGNHVNGPRAAQLLKVLPTKDPVYVSHSSQLYRSRFLQKFPGAQAYVDDQADPTKNYDDKILQIATTMKTKLETDTAAANTTIDPAVYQASLQKAKAEIDTLAAWAKTNKLYWAFQLLYWLQTTQMPTWYTQFTSGALDKAVGIKIKQWNATLGLLELNKINPNGMNMMQSFNKSLQLAQMTSIIPQLVDLEGNESDFDSLLKASLFQFWNNWQFKGDQKMKDAAAAAKLLYEQDQLRKNFYLPLFAAQKVARAAGTWNIILEMWTNSLSTSNWFSALKGASFILEIAGYFAVAVMVFMPLVGGGVDKLSPQMMFTWIGSIVAIGSLFILKIGQIGFRLSRIWHTMSGLRFLGTITGSDLIFDEILPMASRNINNWFVAWAVRTSYEANTPAMALSLSKWSRIFGRTLGETIAALAAVIMGIAIIVITAIDLAAQKEALGIATDAIFIAAAAISVFAVLSGWISIAAAGTAFAATWLGGWMMAALGLVTTWGGPFSIAMALIGLVVFIVWMCLTDRRNPFEKFVDNYVKPAGLYMDYLAVDYFARIPPTTLFPEKVGVSIRTGRIQKPGIPMQGQPTGKAAVYMSAQYPTFSETLQYSSLDVWSVSTDGYGKTIFSAKKFDGIGGWITYCLASGDDNSTFEIRILPSLIDFSSDTEYDKALAHAQWTVTTLENPETVGTDAVQGKQPLSMLVSIMQGSLTLVLELDPITSAPLGLKLYDAKTLQSPNQPQFALAWMLDMQPIGPQSFTYLNSPWVIEAGENDAKNSPRFVPGNTSLGLRWSISPALPSPFVLNTTPGLDEGCITTTPGKPVPAMAATTFTVTCRMLGIGQAMLIEKTTQISIQVNTNSAQ